MSAITWVNTDPTDASNASDLDDAIRSFASNTAAGLGTSLTWPGSGGGSATSAGFAALGTARAAFGSTLGGAAGAGFLSYDTYRGALVESSGSSNVVGHASMLERPFAFGSDQSVGWKAQSGSTLSTVGAAVFAISFTSAYSGAPYVQLTTSTFNVLSVLSTVDGSGFTSICSHLVGSASTFTLYWVSEGTLAL